MKLETRPGAGAVERLTRRCREAGLAVTPQRLEIFKALVSAEDHPSPEMLHERIRGAMPTLSLATIYKTLDVLEELGLVEALGGSKRYDGNHVQHHHLVCTRCKSVTDFYDSKLDALHPPKQQLHGFVPESVTVQIKGLCANCKT